MDDKNSLTAYLIQRRDEPTKKDKNNTTKDNKLQVVGCIENQKQQPITANKNSELDIITAHKIKLT